MSKVWGPAQVTPHGSAPTFVDLTNGVSRPGFLGQVHAAYVPDGVGRDNLKLNNQVSVKRLDDRKALLGGLNSVRSPDVLDAGRTRGQIGDQPTSHRENTTILHDADVGIGTVDINPIELLAKVDVGQASLF